jgi:hypothetical protein
VVGAAPRRPFSPLAQHRARHIGGVRPVDGRSDGRGGPGEEAAVGDCRPVDSCRCDDLSRWAGWRPAIPAFTDDTVHPIELDHDQPADDHSERSVDDDHHVSVLVDLHHAVDHDHHAIVAVQPDDQAGLEWIDAGELRLVVGCNVVGLVVWRRGIGCLVARRRHPAVGRIARRQNTLTKRSATSKL